MKFFATIPFVLGAALQAVAQVSDAAKAAELVADLKKAPTQVARLNILKNNRDWLFDYNAGVGTVRSAGGNSTLANVANFPALFANGMAMAIGHMAPCGMNSPHTHPRATELLYVVNGEIEAGFIEENGARFVSNTVTQGQGTIFPKGSIHYQVNTGCEPVTFVAALNDEDPGASLIAQRFFGLPPDVVAATLGDVGVKEVVNLATGIPDNFVIGVDRCLQKCNLKRGQQSKNQQQPRVDGNAFPN
ncbi:spherulin 1a [Thelephora ganbajun]|uniref:Spherulin 1a n=1 Tax=Thelephora ganbajun TaxID=370292 RepID=A0ACB6Z6Q5_THEGA|nr:spherulin 1a [Thelephora ganbajun]